MTEADRHSIDFIDLRARILDVARSDVHRAGGFPNGVAPTPQNILTVAEAYRDFIFPDESKLKLAMKLNVG